MPMKNPPHPGHSIKDACLEPLGLSVTQAANVLGIARHTLSRVLNGGGPVFLPKWRSGWRRLDGRTPIIGCGCRRPMTLRKPVNMSRGSRIHRYRPRPAA